MSMTVRNVRDNSDTVRTSLGIGRAFVLQVNRQSAQCRLGNQIKKKTKAMIISSAKYLL